MSAARSLCKYTWEVMVCMVLTGEGHLGSDRLPKTLQQAESTESMMRATWNTEAMRWQKANGTSNCPLFFTGKEAKHVRALFLICDWY